MAGYPHIGAVFQVVYSGDDEPPAPSEVEAWILNYELHNSTLLPDGNADAVLSALDRRECAFIVETGCMTIQWKVCSNEGAPDGLEQLDVALTQ